MISYNPTNGPNIGSHRYAVVDDTGHLSTKTSLADGGQIDSFGRLRVSQITTQLDLKQIHDNLPLFYDREVIGTALSTYNSSTSSSTLSTSADSDAVIVQSKQRAHYQSGKSHQIFVTFSNFEVETNITKRVGYFTSTTTTPFNSGFDGFWLESNANGIELVLHNNGSELSRINQSAWNDRLDGTGASRITIDWSKDQILMVSLEWLGVGGIIFSLVVDSQIIPFHQLKHANVLSNVYMKSPHKPIRYEIRQSGVGSGSFEQICAAAGSEGSLNDIAVIHSEDLGISYVDANNTANTYALIGMRLQSAKADASVDIVNFDILVDTSTDVLWKLMLNPTVSGTFTYNDISNSAVSIAYGDTAADPSTNTISGGTKLASGFIKSGAGNTSGGNIKGTFSNSIRIGQNIDGTLDTIVLCAQPIDANADVTAALTWQERI